MFEHRPGVDRRQVNPTEQNSGQLTPRHTENRADARTGTREQIVAAARPLRDSGATAVTTRVVAQQAGVPPPRIFHLFGDEARAVDMIHAAGTGVVLTLLARPAFDARDLMPAGRRHRNKIYLRS